MIIKLEINSYIRVASRVADWIITYDPRKLGNVRKIPKIYRIIP